MDGSGDRLTGINQRPEPVSRDRRTSAISQERKCGTGGAKVNLTQFILALGSTCRITRFVVKDTLAAGFRIWVADHFGEESKLAYLVTCSWCTSIWVAGGVAPLAYYLGGSLWIQIPAIALTLSYLSGVASLWLD